MIENALSTSLFVFVPLTILALIAILILIAPLIWDRSVGADDGRRNHTMDGVRGLLTLWVLTHHLNAIPASLSHSPLKLSFASDSTVILLMSSSFFTAPFYTLTGMLFGGSILATRGKMDGFRFLKNRLFRLVPVYAISILFVTLIAFGMSGFRLHSTPAALIKALIRWCSFGFLPRYDINGAPVASWHGMLWTLKYEIAFYLLLPLIAWGQRRTRNPAVIFLVLGAVSFFAPQFIFFTAGAVAAVVANWKKSAPVLWSGLALLCIYLIPATATITGPVLQSALLIPILAAAATQAPLLNPLQLRPLRFVGEISYSVYILHYPFLCMFFTLMAKPEGIDTLSYPARVGALAAIGAGIILLSALSYVFVERPLIQIGKRWQPFRSGARQVAAYPAKTATARSTPSHPPQQ